MKIKTINNSCENVIKIYTTHYKRSNGYEENRKIKRKRDGDKDIKKNVNGNKGMEVYILQGF